MIEKIPADTLGAIVDKGTFREANLEDLDLRGASLYWTIFIQATLAEARLQEANMENADFTDADLRSSSLYEAQATQASFTSAGLYDAWMIDTNLFEANLSLTDLSEALLYGTDISTVTFGENIRFRVPFTTVILCCHPG